MYTICISISLGSENAGLSLTGQLIDTVGQDTGDPIATGFVEIGGGHYLLTASMADDFIGGIKILSGTDLLAFSSVNPGPPSVNYVRDAILSDSTPFAGANINLLPTIAAAVSGLVNVTVVNPAAASGDVTTIQGDDYSSARGREISWKGYGIWPDDISGATVTAIIDYETEIACTIVISSGEGQEVICEPTGAETLIIGVGKHLLQVIATWDGDPDENVTLVYGWWTSLQRIGA